MVPTLDELERMSEQRIFDTIALHLLTQNEKAFDPATGRCLYRMADGRMCGVGAILPDECYSPYYEGRYISELAFDIYRTCWPLGRILTKHLSLLIELQRIHDRGEPFAWGAMLIMAAAMFGLDATFVRQAIAHTKVMREVIPRQPLYPSFFGTDHVSTQYEIPAEAGPA